MQVGGAMKQWIVARLAERSTWLGIAGFVGLFGYQLSPAFVEFAIALASGLLIVTKDK